MMVRRNFMFFNDQLGVFWKILILVVCKKEVFFCLRKNFVQKMQGTFYSWGRPLLPFFIVKLFFSSSSTIWIWRLPKV